MKFDENEIRKAISIMKPQNSLLKSGSLPQEAGMQAVISEMRIPVLMQCGESVWMETAMCISR